MNQISFKAIRFKSQAKRFLAEQQKRAEEKLEEMIE